MRIPLLSLLLIIATAATASAQGIAAPTAGAMPQMLPPAIQPPSSMPSSPSVSPGGTAAGARYPSTESLSRDRIRSQGYKVERITPRYDGEWKADTTRDPVPTRPKGTPSKVTILPDGQMLEEWN